jgi:hypothetical protein
VTIFDAFVAAVNKRLSEPARSDYDVHTNLVERVSPN